MVANYRCTELKDEAMVLIKEKVNKLNQQSLDGKYNDKFKD